MLVYALALFFFAGMDAASKYLALRHPLPMVAWTRYFVHLLWMTAIFMPSMGRQLVQVQRPHWVLLRGACLVGITVFMMLALRRLPLAEATSIVYLAPLLVVVLAQPVLHERIGRLRWCAVLGGFAGVMLIIRPGSDLDPLGVACALLVALCMTAYQLFTRVLSYSENAVAMLYYSALLGTAVFGVLLPWFWFSEMPSLLEILLYLCLGSFGFFGHLCFTLAFRDAPASVLAPISYAQLLWAALLGWLAFEQVPDALSVLGMLIITAGGVVVALAERSRAQSG
jgi:drug/metabolite transporter (DMT)-like permease